MFTGHWGSELGFLKDPQQPSLANTACPEAEAKNHTGGGGKKKGAAGRLTAKLSPALPHTYTHSLSSPPPRASC